MNTIILTGAICPSYPMQRNDPLVRLVDYLCAIRRWIDTPTLNQVIYCDASGSRIPEDVFSTEKFESLSFDASDYARRYEAGRAEAESLVFILEKSRFCFDSFFKCTGRHYVNNFSIIQQEIYQNENINLALREWYLPEWADTRFFWMTKIIFENLLQPRINELTGHDFNGHVLESLFFEFLDQAKTFTEPEIVGYSGHLNYVYMTDFHANEKKQAIEIVNYFGLGHFYDHTS